MEHLSERASEKPSGFSPAGRVGTVARPADALGYLPCVCARSSPSTVCCAVAGVELSNFFGSLDSSFFRARAPLLYFLFRRARGYGCWRIGFSAARRRFAVEVWKWVEAESFIHRGE